MTSLRQQVNNQNQNSQNVFWWMSDFGRVGGPNDIFPYNPLLYAAASTVKQPQETFDAEWFYQPTDVAVALQQKIRLKKYHASIRLTNQCNTTANLEIYYLTPRMDLQRTITSQSPQSPFPGRQDVETDPINLMKAGLNVMGVTPDAERLKWMTSPTSNIWNLPIIWDHWKMYRKGGTKKISILPGQQKIIKLSMGKEREIKCTRIIDNMWLKGISKLLLFRCKGSPIIGPVEGEINQWVTTYSDYCVGQIKEERLWFNNMAVQQKALTKPDFISGLADVVQVINPVSGNLEEEKDVVSI